MQGSLCELRHEFSREPGNPTVDATRAVNSNVDAEENAQEQVGEISIRGLLGRIQHVPLIVTEAYFQARGRMCGASDSNGRSE